MPESNCKFKENNIDPTANVLLLVEKSVDRLEDLRIAENKRQDDLRELEVKRIDHGIAVEIDRVDDRFKDNDVKYQIQFNAAKEALGIALIAQEKAVASALDSTKEAINKAEIATDKRFELLSEKIDGVSELLNKNAGAQGIYVTHTDLSNEMSKLRADFEIMIRPVVTYMNSTQGQQKGQGMGWAWILGGVTFFAAIIALVLNAMRLFGKGL